MSDFDNDKTLINNAINVESLDKGRTIPVKEVESSVLGRIDQYELHKELGGGGFGTVYLARDTVGHREVAVKGLPPLVQSNREELENIRTNFALVQGLHHPNIAAALVLHPAKDVIYNSEDTRRKLRVLSGETLLVMEYAPGVTLSKWRKQFHGSKVPLEMALEIVRQVAEALDYAHSQNIIHRDVKPSNVVVETKPDGSVAARVLDFGLAAEIRSSMGRFSKEVRDTSGTRPYMAPEQWRGEKQGPATDQYALAAMFFELLTGEVPFSSVFDCGDPMVMMVTVTASPVNIPDDLPKPIRSALAKALAKKREERFPSCGEFAAALGARAAIHAASKPRLGKAGVSPRKKSVWLVIPAVLALLGGGYIVFARRQAEKAKLEIEKSNAFALESEMSLALKVVKDKRHDPGQGFRDRIKALEKYYLAGKAALDAREYPVALNNLSLARTAAEWIKSNAVFRADALNERMAAESGGRNAVAAKADELDAAGYATATNLFADALQKFESGNFVEAKAEFSKTLDAFKTNLVAANKEAERRRIEKRKADTAAAISAFEAEPPDWNGGVRLSQSADRDDAAIQFYLGVCCDFGYGGVANDPSEAVKWYRKAADQGHKVAQFNLGVSYSKGSGVQEDQAEATKWYRKAGEQGYREAQFALGKRYFNGIGVDKDEAEAVKWYRMAAELGHRDAQFNLGVCYDNGSGVEKDEVQAVEWYRKAADQGEAAAQYNLGVCYANGLGVDKNLSEAAKWYLKAAELGNQNAQFNIGVYYDKGCGVAKDSAEAVKWYRKAAEQGHRTAQFNLGVCYNNGEGVAKDVSEAVKWYRKAAEQGDASAQFNMGLCCSKGQGVHPDAVEAAGWYLKAAEQGHRTAQFNLGVCYDNGEGVAKDEAEAVKWYRKAAEQGDASAQFNLGVSYGNGQGVQKDETEAVKWYRKAAEQNYRAAQFSMGLCYANGRGVEKDDAVAADWFRNAAGQGHHGAQFYLGESYAKGRGVPKDDAMAVEWYRKAAEHGHRDAQSNLGVCYANGQGVEKNETEAVNWFRKAADQNDTVALFNLGECYSHAKGVQKDDSEAAKYYRKAAAHGHREAQYNLAVCYANGQGVQKNDSEAAVWYRKSAEQGHREAQLNMGICYDNGLGVRRDEVEAVKWYRMAAEKGSDTAEFNLGVCYANGLGVQKNETEAFKWYRKAAEQGHWSAQFNVGVCYDNGRGVLKDEAEAVKWYLKAAEQGHLVAQFNLGVCYANGLGVTKNEVESVKWYTKAAEKGNAVAQRTLGVCYANGKGVPKNEVEAVKWYRKAAEKGDAQGQFLLGDAYESGKGVEKDSAAANLWYEKSAVQGNLSARKALVRINGASGVTYESALSMLNINLDAVFPADKVVDVPAGADLEKTVKDCPDGATLRLAAGTYAISGAKQLSFSKNLRIIGVSPESTHISGKLYSYNPSDKSGTVLVVENLAFEFEKTGDNCDYGVSGADGGVLTVTHCRFANCGIRVSAKSRAVLADIAVDNAEWGIDVSEAAKAVVLNAQLTNTTRYFIIGFKNSRVFCEDVVMSGGVDAGVFALYDGSQWFMRCCYVRNLMPPKYASYGIGVTAGSKVKVYLDSVTFENLTGAPVDNSGTCVYRNLTVRQCGEDLKGNGSYLKQDDPIPLPEGFFR